MVTEHYEIISTLRDEEFEAAMPRFLEDAYQQYADTLPPRSGSTTRMTTYVFGSRSEWARFTGRRFPERYEVYARIQTGGFTEGETSLSFYANRSALLATLAHEGWHQYLAATIDQPIPAWLNEGLACYHEALEWIGESPKFTPQRNTFRMNALREAVQRNRLIPLRELLAVDAGWALSHDHREVAQTYYAQVWALMVFLRDGDDASRAKAFEKMLAEIAAGSFSARVSATQLTTAHDGSALGFGESVFRAYFEASPEALDTEYRGFVEQLAGLVAIGQ